MTKTIGSATFALIRRPLLPMATFTDWHASAGAEQFVIDQYLDPLLEEALYIASAALHGRLLQLRGSGAALEGTERRSALVSLSKFLSRAAFRCTPFGLFAQVQYARVDAAAAPASPRAIRRGIHLDAGVEARLLEAALKDHDWRATLCWQISSTAHVVGAHLAYVDWIYQDNGQRNYRAIELAMNEGLALLKQRCQEPQPFEQLCAALVGELEVDADEARQFLHQSIDRRLLLPQLAATAASCCSLDRLLSAGAPHPATATLRAVQRQLHALRAHAASPAALVPHYQALQATVETQVDAAHLKHGVVQVDSIDDANASIEPAVAERIAVAAQLLARHTARRRGALDDYKRLFRERFEEREVNLAYALHSELGIPFPAKGALGSPLLDGLRLAPEAPPESAAPLLNAFDKLLVERLFEAAASGQSSIVISAADLAALPAPTPSPHLLAEGLYAHVSVLPGADGAPPPIQLHGVDGRNGLEMLGRFCHLSDQLGAAARQYSDSGARDDAAIYAEIIHHPQDRLLNILRRPRLGTHDIVFAGASELPRDRQLWMEDLTVQLVGERFVLRERDSGRQVIARLTSAHNYSARQLGTYQFLCQLQDDDAAWIGFHWPHATRHLPRLPRVEVAGLIVARAQWTLKKDDIEALNRALVGHTLAHWRNARRLPRFVTIDQGDNRLPIDLDNPASAYMLLDEIIKLPSATVQECLALNLALEHAGMSLHNQEWVLPLNLARADPPARTPAAAPAARPPRQLQREGQVCAALDDWAYLRIYTGSGHADRVLRDVVMPAMQAAVAAGAIERWFFVRYQDRFEHLRLRFHGRRHDALLHTLAGLHRDLERARADGLLWRVVGDHYVPETQRYGGAPAMALCEQLFRIDSDDMRVLLDIESALADSAAADAPPRWLFALASLDAYALRLCPEHAERERMLDTLAGDFLNEQAPGAARSQALVALGGRFRDMRKELDSLRHDSGPLARWRAGRRTCTAARPSATR
ncbi:lantibiotic dehydratase [Janthinobacterium sp. CG_S6]|uniref:lantibiotic dehydratase n=1 Tax=unclassified Janthinobacterium TaxID=2610881 RepID=UPI0018DED1D8|nr:lantibiotic dehydratase [Janthinobacterium sp. CG3]MEC5160717.1 thiopeptide-type bacteriocin biosynthesis protein [Janthinobacterium sp. CG_S6]